MLVHYSRLTVCQSTAPLLPGVGLHGDTTAEDHWPLHRRHHQSCNKQTWPVMLQTKAIRRFVITEKAPTRKVYSAALKKTIIYCYIYNLELL